MRVVCTADLHESLPHIPESDLLIIAGDLGFMHAHDTYGYHDWLLDKFVPWLEAAPVKETVMVAGNHDFFFEKHPLPHGVNVHYLQDSGIELFGKKIWGSPWQPWFGDWAFNAPKGMNGEIFLAEKFSDIPMDTDIVVCHGPPRGVGDIPGHRPKEHVGSAALTQRLLEVRPELFVCGHIHGSYGQYLLDGIPVINASLMSEGYRPTNPPILVELPDANVWKAGLSERN